MTVDDIARLAASDQALTLIVVAKEFGGTPSQRLAIVDPFLAYQLDAALAWRSLELRNADGREDPQRQFEAARARMDAATRKIRGG